jgi:hypothetical protein
VIAPWVGALWIGLVMQAAGDGSPEPAPLAVPEPAPLAAPEPTPAPTPAPVAVAVMRPPRGDAVLEETGSRIRSELAAMGLEGEFVDCPPEAATDPDACPDLEAAATISLAREAGVVQISVRTILPDGLELRRHVRVFAHDGGDDPSVLAVRAVELLRDLRLTGQRPRPHRPTGPARDDEDPKIPLPPPPPPVPPRWRLSAGGALLASPAHGRPGVGPESGVAISAGAVIGPRLLLFASFVGPFDTSISALNPGEPLATGRLVQALVTLELRFKFRAGPLEPFGALLTGLNYLKETVTVPGGEGTTVPKTGSAWVPMFGIGGGVSWSFWKRFYLCADAAAFVTQPTILVNIVDRFGGDHVVARTGDPSILISSSAGLALP